MATKTANAHKCINYIINIVFLYNHICGDEHKSDRNM